MLVIHRWYNYESEEDKTERERQTEALDTYQHIHDGDMRRSGRQSAEHGSSSSTPAEAGSSEMAGPTPQRVLDESLQAHFNSIQTLSDKQALEDLLPRLKETLNTVSMYLSLFVHPVACEQQYQVECMHASADSA